MVINCVTYVFEHGNREQFYSSIHGLLDDIRKNPGLLEWEYYIPEEDDGRTLYLFERWKDQEAIDHYHTLDTYKKYQAIKQEAGCTFSLFSVKQLD